MKTFRKGRVKNDGCNSFCSCSDLNVLHTEGYHRLELKLHQISALCSDGGGDDVVAAVVSGIAFYPAWRGRPAVVLQSQQDTISVGSTPYINWTQSLVKEITEENKVPQPPSARHIRLKRIRLRPFSDICLYFFMQVHLPLCKQQQSLISWLKAWLSLENIYYTTMVHSHKTDWWGHTHTEHTFPLACKYTILTLKHTTRRDMYSTHYLRYVSVFYSYWNTQRGIP